MESVARQFGNVPRLSKDQRAIHDEIMTMAGRLSRQLDQVLDPMRIMSERLPTPLLKVQMGVFLKESYEPVLERVDLLKKGLPEQSQRSVEKLMQGIRNRFTLAIQEREAAEQIQIDAKARETQKPQESEQSEQSEQA